MNNEEHGKGPGSGLVSGERSQVHGCCLPESQHCRHESCQIFATESDSLLRVIQMVTTAIVNYKGLPDRNNPKHSKLTK